MAPSPAGNDDFEASIAILRGRPIVRSTAKEQSEDSKRVSVSGETCKLSSAVERWCPRHQI